MVEFGNNIFNFVVDIFLVPVIMGLQVRRGCTRATAFVPATKTGLNSEQTANVTILEALHMAASDAALFTDYDANLLPVEIPKLK